MSVHLSKAHYPRRLSAHIQIFTAHYCIASLVHFAHNAEYIAFYPNMPAWLTREQVYMVWAAVTSVGLVAFVLKMLGRTLASVLCLTVYAAFGFDALGHYAMALCSQHTLAQNFTIWFEEATGAALLSGCVWYMADRLRDRC